MYKHTHTMYVQYKKNLLSLSLSLLWRSERGAESCVSVEVIVSLIQTVLSFIIYVYVYLFVFSCLVVGFLFRVVY